MSDENTSRYYETWRDDPKLNGANAKAGSSFAAPSGSVKITHPFSGIMIVTLHNNLHERLWLTREEAMELLEQLPSAIAQMPVSISPNNSMRVSE